MQSINMQTIANRERVRDFESDETRYIREAAPGGVWESFTAHQYACQNEPDDAPHMHVADL